MLEGVLIYLGILVVLGLVAYFMQEYDMTSPPDPNVEVSPEAPLGLRLAGFLQYLVNEVPDDAVMEIITTEMLHWEEELNALGHKVDIIEQAADEKEFDGFYFSYYTEPRIKEQLKQYLDKPANTENILALTIYHKDWLTISNKVSAGTDIYRKNRTIYLEMGRDAKGFHLALDRLFKKRLEQALNDEH